MHHMTLARRRQDQVYTTMLDFLFHDLVKMCDPGVRVTKGGCMFVRWTRL